MFAARGVREGSASVHLFDVVLETVIELQVVACARGQRSGSSVILCVCMTATGHNAVSPATGANVPVCYGALRVNPALADLMRIVCFSCCSAHMADGKDCSRPSIPPTPSVTSKASQNQGSVVKSSNRNHYSAGTAGNTSLCSDIAAPCTLDKVCARQKVHVAAQTQQLLDHFTTHQERKQMAASERMMSNSTT